MPKIIEKVTVTEILPIFKHDEPANAIEVIHFKFGSGEECGYDIVAQKGLYEIGSNAYFIQPDHCLSDNALFEAFIRPNGDPSKSKLKTNYRIRAIKFNFTFENESNSIYSCGILLPEKEVLNYLRTLNDTGEKSLDELLGVSKYEEPEEGSSGLTGGKFPSYLYKTDEPTIQNSKKRIARIVEEKQAVGLTFKYDGCCDENTLIMTEKEGNKTIKSICDSLYFGNVLSYNIDNKICEYKPIVKHSIKENNDDWYLITLDDLTEIKLTGNHLVYLPKLMCYREVKNLTGTEVFLVQ